VYFESAALTVPPISAFAAGDPAAGSRLARLHEQRPVTLTVWRLALLVVWYFYNSRDMDPKRQLTGLSDRLNVSCSKTTAFEKLTPSVTGIPG
jgi:hypothetical protein